MKRAIVLVHDEPHGVPLIDALARFGDGLPAHVLPFAVNEVTQIGLESIAAAFAYGASAVRFLLRARPRHDVSGLMRTIALADPILAGLGFGSGRVATIETDDPDRLIEALARRSRSMPPAPRPASFRPVGEQARRAALCAERTSPRGTRPRSMSSRCPTARRSAPWKLDAGGCTLCLSCVSACPTGALRDDPERPCCALSKTPACSADCAGRPARRRSSR